MSPDERTRILTEAETAGVDLSLLRENLRLTPAERFEKHQRAAEFVLSLRRARRVTDVQPSNPPEAAP